MIDDDLVLRVERFRDSIESFKAELRKRYALQTARVSANVVRTKAAQLAERWLAEVAAREDVKFAITEEVLGNLNVAFQRLLTCTESTNPRASYDSTLSVILKDFRSNVIVALKQKRGVGVAAPRQQNPDISPRSAFVGQSFAELDDDVNETVRAFLVAFGLSVTTGERSMAQAVSAKIKERIEKAYMFVGIFTRREKLSKNKGWSTSAWVIDEKAYALAKGKRLILLKEVGVNSVGGLQGDYEYLEFERKNLASLLVHLLETLRGVA